VELVALIPDLSADEWSALAAWTAVLLATVAGLIARSQLREARRQRRQQAQPYVVVFCESSPVGDVVLDVVVKNFGTTAAHDISIEIDPPLRRAVASDEEAQIPGLIPVLVPAQEWRTFWDSGIARADSELPDRHTAVVRFTDSDGHNFGPYKFVLDLEPIKAREYTPIYGTHHVAQALREISKEVKKWREGATGGLKVYGRDGDARDARIREHMEERRAARKQASDDP
jgi:hypothetical protein